MKLCMRNLRAQWNFHIVCRGFAKFYLLLFCIPKSYVQRARLLYCSNLATLWSLIKSDRHNLESKNWILISWENANTGNMRFVGASVMKAFHLLFFSPWNHEIEHLWGFQPTTACKVLRFRVVSRKKSWADCRFGLWEFQNCEQYELWIPRQRHYVNFMRGCKNLGNYRHSQLFTCSCPSSWLQFMLALACEKLAKNVWILLNVKIFTFYTSFTFLVRIFISCKGNERLLTRFSHFVCIKNAALRLTMNE